MQVIPSGEQAVLIAAARILRQIYDRGFVDYHASDTPGAAGDADLPGMAAQLDHIVSTYAGCHETPDP